MKGEIRYDKDVDIAMVVLSDKKLAYETEMDDVIVGFSEERTHLAGDSQCGKWIFATT